jgi:CRISPR-associated RAMP protein, csm3 family
MNSIKLNKKIIVTGKLTLKTGLHIGGTNTALGIGGLDSLVVRNPITNVPYIPGSSLKGKMRSLIEVRDATIGADNRATNDPQTAAGALFGTIGKKDEDNHPSRIIVRDAEMDMANAEMLKDTDLPYTESKTEVTINRITAQAVQRTIERVPAGVSFNVNMVINIFDGEDENKLIKTLKDAMALLEDDYLGGNGSRGYGQVEFSEMKFTPKTYAE